MLRPELDAIPPAIAGRGTGFGCANATQPVAAHTISTDPAGLAGGEIAAAEAGWHQYVGGRRGHGVA